MSNPLAVLRVFALVLLVFALTMLAPAAVALVQNDSAAAAFQRGCLATLAAALLLWGLTRRHTEELRIRDAQSCNRRVNQKFSSRICRSKNKN